MYNIFHTKKIIIVYKQLQLKAIINHYVFYSKNNLLIFYLVAAY